MNFKGANNETRIVGAAPDGQPSLISLILWVLLRTAYPCSSEDIAKSLKASGASMREMDELKKSIEVQLNFYFKNQDLRIFDRIRSRTDLWVIRDQFIEHLMNEHAQIFAEIPHNLPLAPAND